MTRLMLRNLVALGCLLATATALPVDGGADDAPMIVDAPPRQLMEALATRAMQQSLGIVIRNGGFYPYALLVDSTGGTTLIGYTGPENNRPAAERFAQELVRTVQEATVDNSEIVSAAVVQPAFLRETPEAPVTPGIWVLVDHRHGDPWVVIQPLLRGERDREYRLGRMVTQATRQPLFRHKAGD